MWGLITKDPRCEKPGCPEPADVVCRCYRPHVGDDPRADHHRLTCLWHTPELAWAREGD